MRLRTLPLIAAVALALPVAAQAEQLSYRYIDVAHFPEAELDGDNVDVDGDGLQLRGSLPVYENIFVYTEFLALDFDRDIDTTRLMIGAGGHWPITSNIDIVGRVGLVNLEADIRGLGDDDDTGIFAGARVRAIVFPKLEVEGGVEHQRVEVFGLENDTYLVGEARYNFTPQWSAGVIVNVGGDTNLIGAQGRFSF
jgi:hypothetical protein